MCHHRKKRDTQVRSGRRAKGAHKTPKKITSKKEERGGLCKSSTIKKKKGERLCGSRGVTKEFQTQDRRERGELGQEKENNRRSSIKR